MALTGKTDQQKENTTDQMASMAKFKELRNSKSKANTAECQS